jgi:hypothetical protein
MKKIRKEIQRYKKRFNAKKAAFLAIAKIFGQDISDCKFDIASVEG